MAITTIDIGAAPDDGTGDPLRRAFQITNENFADLDTTKADTTDVANALALKVDKVSGQTLMTEAERTKLAGIATGATANQTNAYLLNRANHTGGFNGYGAFNDMRDGTPLPASSPPSAFLGKGSIVGLGQANQLGLGSVANINWGVFRCEAQWNTTGTLWGVQRIFTVAGARQFFSYAVSATEWSAWIEPMADKADKTTVAPAIAMAQTFTTLPTTFQAWVIFVTLPHWRTFVWTGTKYERAPWHMPGKIFPADGPAANVRGAIQMRSDVVYNTADYPDLAVFYGFAGPTFVLKDARARVIRGADLGKNTDATLVNGYLQEDAVQNWAGTIGFHGGGTGTVLASSSGGGVEAGGPLGSYRDGGTLISGATSYNAFAVGPSVGGAARTAAETRVKSLVATHYVTI